MPHKKYIFNLLLKISFLFGFQKKFILEVFHKAKFKGIGEEEKIIFLRNLLRKRFEIKKRNMLVLISIKCLFLGTQ